MNIEHVGDIVLASDFWDCDCDKLYIHRKSEVGDCVRCGATQEEAPDSRLDEILILRPSMLTAQERREALEFYKQFVRR